MCFTCLIGSYLSESECVCVCVCVRIDAKIIIIITITEREKESKRKREKEKEKERGKLLFSWTIYFDNLLLFFDITWYNLKSLIHYIISVFFLKKYVRIENMYV